MNLTQKNTGIQEHQPTLLESYKASMIAESMRIETIDKYMAIAEKYVSYLFNRKIHILQTKKGDVTRFINSQGKVSAATWNNKLTYLRQFYKYMQGIEYKMDITISIKRKKGIRGFAKKSLPASVIREMIDYFKNRIEIARASKDKRIRLDTALRDYAFLCVLTSIGSRAGLTTELKVKHVRYAFAENGSRVPVLDLQSKGREEEKTRPIPPYVFDAIEEYLVYTDNINNPDAFVFRGHGKGAIEGQPVTYNNMWERINKVFIRLGIKSKTTDKNKISPHSFRHSLAEFLVADHGVKYVQVFYDHKSQSTTDIYSGRNSEKALLTDRPDIERIYGIE